MKIINPGHIYELQQLGSARTQLITFVKRSGGAVEYDREWPGLQTQEVLRALIDRTQYLIGVLPCVESEDAVYHLRMALWNYETRAWRRKQGKLNRKKPEHDDTERSRAWRKRTFADVPFNEHGIELRPIGADGHLADVEKPA